MIAIRATNLVDSLVDKIRLSNAADRFRSVKVHPGAKLLVIWRHDFAAGSRRESRSAANHLGSCL